MGCTRNDLQKQWKKIIAAAINKLDFPLYREIRTYGSEQFIIDEYERADTSEEAKKIEKEAIELFNANSLRGYKTSNIVIKKRSAKRKKKENEAKLKKLFLINPFVDNETENALIFEKDLKQIHNLEHPFDDSNEHDDCHQQTDEYKTNKKNNAVFVALTQTNIPPKLTQSECSDNKESDIFTKMNEVSTDPLKTTNTFNLNDKTFSCNTNLTQQPKQTKKTTGVDVQEIPFFERKETANCETVSNHEQKNLTTNITTEQLLIEKAIEYHRDTLSSIDAIAARKKRREDLKIKFSNMMSKVYLAKK